ncbi:MAG TPA: TaqI-like C-terminal specificity domain-containing protein [Polyangia bacterium]
MTPRDRKLLGAYYTPAGLIRRALDRLPAPSAQAEVVDLACGEGAWLAAAGERWPAARLVGIDLDPEAVARAAARVPRATLQVGDGISAELSGAELVIGNPPWGAGRSGRVRRGAESASAFVVRALELLRPGGRLCLLLPAAWLEVAAHRSARERLLAACAIERIERWGDVFRGVQAPAALVIARREPDRTARAASQVRTPAGRVRQALFESDPERALNPRLSERDRSLIARLESAGAPLAGRATFVLGVVTGCNRRALDRDAGEPIVAGPDVTPYAIRPPSRRLALPLGRVQQAAPRAAYARPKVIYRFIAPEPVAAVDLDGRLTLNSANALALDDPELDPHFVAAALNSSALGFLHAARTSLPRVLRSHLERLPLPRAAAPEMRKIGKLAAEAGAAASAELDDRVMALFRLEPAERARLRSTWPRS